MIIINQTITRDFVQAWYWYAKDNPIYRLHLGNAVKLVKTMEDIGFIMDLEAWEPDAKERREMREQGMDDFLSGRTNGIPVDALLRST
jgi:hypothetical protein